MHKTATGRISQKYLHTGNAQRHSSRDFHQSCVVHKPCNEGHQRGVPFPPLLSSFECPLRLCPILCLPAYASRARFTSRLPHRLTFVPASYLPFRSPIFLPQPAQPGHCWRRGIKNGRQRAAYNFSPCQQSNSAMKCGSSLKGTGPESELLNVGLSL